jgi:hypothetical protein
MRQLQQRGILVRALSFFRYLSTCFPQKYQIFHFSMCALGLAGVALLNKERRMANTTIKAQILAALSHPEAEDGLYFNNLIVVHEEEERPIVEGDEAAVMAAIEELLEDGRIKVSGEGDQRIFQLA